MTTAQSDNFRWFVLSIKQTQFLLELILKQRRSEPENVTFSREQQ